MILNIYMLRTLVYICHATQTVKVNRMTSPTIHEPSDFYVKFTDMPKLTPIVRLYGRDLSQGIMQLTYQQAVIICAEIAQRTTETK